MKWLQYLYILMCSFLVANLKAEEITIAVASNFSATMSEIVDQFETETGHKVRLVFGASGKFVAQIKNGAPFQGFFSADQNKPAVLEKAGLIVPGSRFTYATGALALWSPKLNYVDQQAEVLRLGNFNKLALANSKLAPYGTAALEVLQSLGLEAKTRAKWVRGQNIAQTYQFVSTGNADLGFVAVSQIFEKGTLKTGSAWVVPGHLYSPIRQDAVLLLAGENSEGTKELMEFIRSNKARGIIESFGYHTKRAIKHKGNNNK